MCLGSVFALEDMLHMMGFLSCGLLWAVLVSRVYLVSYVQILDRTSLRVLVSDGVGEDYKSRFCAFTLRGVIGIGI